MSDEAKVYDAEDLTDFREEHSECDSHCNERRWLATLDAERATSAEWKARAEKAEQRVTWLEARNDALERDNKHMRDVCDQEVKRAEEQERRASAHWEAVEAWKARAEKANLSGAVARENTLLKTSLGEALFRQEQATVRALNAERDLATVRAAHGCKGRCLK